MTLPNEPHLQRLQFYATTAYPCGYLPDRQAQSLIAAPYHLVDAVMYSRLIQQGFRRSGKFTYRPYCTHCQSCVPVRLPVERLQPTRSQRRAWRRHAGLHAKILPLHYAEAHFALYQAYQRSRHPAGGMDADGVEQYQSFLMQSNVESALVEFREGPTLRMVSVVDCVVDGLSAVYTFYDCTDPTASYGTYSILWLADWCRRQGLPYLYLGYWIAESRKMAYKARFRPIEALIDHVWQPLHADKGLNADV